jgi:hypothetical protein
MADADRIAAALRYQQELDAAQRPATMNPNLAAQGQAYRANMTPPTSVMDPRYPAWKQNQDAADAVGAVGDLALSAIPMAGPAMQGVKAAGRFAGPELARGLENYMGRTGMRLSAVPEPSTMRLFHRSPQENLVEVDKRGRFGGIFAGSDPESAIGLSPRKTFLHYADVPENSIADSSALINASENKINVANNAIKNSINPKYHQQENIDAIKDVALNDRNIFKMIDPDTNKPTEELQSIFKALGTDDLGEASWELQKIRGSIAKELGFKAVTMSDEQGLSYFLTPGIKLKAGKGE